MKQFVLEGKETTRVRWLQSNHMTCQKLNSGFSVILLLWSKANVELHFIYCI